MKKIDFRIRHALFSADATRLIEHAAQAALPAHALMQRAGLALAQLALALAPHAQRIWIACGPGNNGGDGMEAAMHLQRWGKQPVVSWLGSIDTAPPDAAASYQRALTAGVSFMQGMPHDFDLCLDALLGLGAVVREPTGRMADWIHQINASAGPVLAADLPSGLNTDTGASTQLSVKASHTLSLLTLKPGLFTAHGRDAAGSIWLADLDVDQSVKLPSAWLAGAPALPTRMHA